jgi:SAM-dependent methyltransferase
VRLPGRELVGLLAQALPADHARQTLATQYIEAAVGHPGEVRPWRVLDLGCGAGSSVELFRRRDPSVEWVGVDIPGSREAGARTRTDARFEIFDGVSLPFEAASFDLVYCHQVLEHVRHPGRLLGDVARVLAPGGYCAGSTSQLEPFHSLSLWNYTPVGFAVLIDEVGLRLVELRPGIDALALITRRLVARGRLAERVWGRWWAGQSPLNRLIDLHARTRGLDAATVNANKLLFSGQFTFLVQRVERTIEPGRPAALN